MVAGAVASGAAEPAPGSPRPSAAMTAASDATAPAPPAARPAGASAEPAAGASPADPTATPSSDRAPATAGPSVYGSGPAPGGLREPAPRPIAEVRVQNRFARNASTAQLFGGVDYLERRDFYVSPGIRLGGTYFTGESLGVEVQVSHFFSRLNQAAQQVQHAYGVLPDSRAPTWLCVGGIRYAIGYGKMMIAGVDRAIHFQPQALMQVGFHVHDDSVGPSGMAGLGLLVHVTPRWFVRLDGAATLEIESRATGSATVLGFLPSLVMGGVL
jgi:hypothetical protein